MPKYEVENFVVYEVGPDGTRRECAYIEDTGEVVPYDASSGQPSFPSPSPHPRPAPSGQKSGGRWKSNLLVFALVMCGALGALLYRQITINTETRSDARQQKELYTRQLEEAQAQNTDLDRQLATARSERAEMSKELEMVRSKMPLVIESIKIGNAYKGGDIETGYGLIIRASRTMYLTPQITYYGLTNGEQSLTVKWIQPNGDVSAQPTHDYTVRTGTGTLNLTGWGNENMGSFWRAGSYRIEIWRGGVCLGSASFTIWS